MRPSAEHRCPAAGDQAVYRDGKVNVPLTDEYQVGVLFHTQGIGVTAAAASTAMPLPCGTSGRFGLFQAPEIQTSNPIYENGRPYVYGKQNTLQSCGCGTASRTFVPKNRRDAVRFSTFWKAGAALAVLKPVHLEIGYPDIPYDYTATNDMIQMRIFQTTYTAGPIGATGWMS